jgi:hypothetical protein
MVSPDSIREALVELLGRHHPESVAADLAAFTSGYDEGAKVAAVV